MKLKFKFSPLKSSKTIARSLFSFFIPAGLPFLLAVIILNLRIMDKVLPNSALIFPIIVIGAGILLGLFFKRIWLMLVILILVIADRALLHFAANTAVTMEGGRLIYHAISLLLPFNLCVFAFMKRKGDMKWQSIWFLGAILLQGCGVAFIYQYRSLGFGTFLEYSSMKWAFLERIPLSQLALFAFGIAFVYYLFLYIRTRGVIERAFCWAIISIFYALALSTIGPVSSIYFSTAGLIFVISVIENIYVEGFQDELTDLPTGKSMHGILSQLDTGYTVALIEVDNFERVKDNHGRRVSKQVLRSVGSKLTSVTGGGKPFRYRGEVFAVVFPGMFLPNALPHMEELRQTIKKSGPVLQSQKSPRKNPKRLKRVEMLANKVQVKVSIGVAERGDADMSPQQAILKAEEALSTAKREGHDQMSPAFISVEFEAL
ncbi:MAG TPA: GGDEF domain-containing protein [Candidatus Aminicenantes bacterium]|nr:GGDEF domain-containing protein [Candidatus Aminicenantes bacterium]